MRHLRNSLAVSLSIMALAVAGCGDDGGSADAPPAQNGGAAGAAGASGGAGTAGSGQGGSAGTAGSGGTAGTGTGGAAGSSGAAGTGGTAGAGGSAPVDADKDGADSTVDCDDNNPDVNPSATEICDGIDNNCDKAVDEGVKKTFYVDADSDSYGIDDAATNQSACTAPSGYAEVAGDCKDSDAAINPGATEVCDAVDNNCTGGVDDGLTKSKYYPDTDKDGFGTDAGMVEGCAAPGENYATQGGDCDDANPAVNPGATEACDAVDNDCDTQIDEGVTTTFYVDADADGFGVDAAGTNVAACTVPTGYASVAGDCDDSRTAVNPGATEICDELDNDCDTQVDEGVTKNKYYPDTDKDGYGSDAGMVEGCSAPAGDYSLQGGDCDNNDAARFPGNTEVCDGKDNDCNNATPEPGLGTYYRDADNDTFGNPANSTSACALPAGYVTNSLDCNDASAAINPNAIEVCDNVDNNCVGGTDEGPVETWPDVDGDTFGDAKATSTFRCAADAAHVTNNKDCNDAVKAINPDAIEIPGNSVDENCDGSDTPSGTVCGHDTYGVTTIPYSNNSGSLLASENYAGNPAGAGYFWDDYEISTLAGQSFTALMHADDPATMRPRMYLNANSCGPTGFVSNNGWFTSNPSGSYGRARIIVNSAQVGYYYQVLTTNVAGQTGGYDYVVIPGTLGTSCGGDDGGLWPLGYREIQALYTTDQQPAGTPVPAGYAADDYEFYLTASQTYTLLYGGMTYSERMYLARAGACGTALATSTGGILIAGARQVYTPTQSGIYAAYLSSTSTTATGGYTFNVVPGNVGESCFAGNGNGTGSGAGDAYVLYPLGGSTSQGLAIGDRVDTVFGNRFFDDYETWLEKGQSVTFTMTTPSGGYVPRLRLAAASACTTSLVTSTAMTGNTATVTYTAPSAGIYVIVASSYSTSQTGNYTLASQYN